MTINCPDCDRQLSSAATTCRCGWRRPAAHAAVERPAPRRAECLMTDGCEQPAIMRRRMPDGRIVNSCYQCDVDAVKRESEAALERRGLGKREDESPCEYRARMMSHIRRHGGVTEIGKHTAAPPVKEREPDEDEEFNFQPT